MQAGDSQIGNDLCRVNRNQFLHGFQFNYYLFFDDQVDSITRGNPDAFVGEWDRVLRTVGNALSRKLDLEASHVAGLQQARSEMSMHFDRRTDDATGDHIEMSGNVHAGGRSKSPAGNR